MTAFRAIYGGPGLCLVDRDSVTTYDGLTYNATASGCNQIITKDCSGRYKMAVLSRQDSNNKKVFDSFASKLMINVTQRLYNSV